LLIKFVLLTRTSFLFSSFGGSLILFAATIAIASAFYLLIEKPLIRWLNKALA
jgi:peptidoglycan/LPS O-acetylase OafA/YrhL